MLYTLTLNPSLDYHVETSEFILGKTNRTCFEEIRIGGKGLNVSIVLKNLGIDNIALGFISGFTGEEIKKRLDNLNIKHHLIDVKNGFSRINIKLKQDDKESELNGQGPIVSKEDFIKLLTFFDGLKENDILVLSGSIAKGMNKDCYSLIMDRIKDKSIKVVVDTTNNYLKSVLEYKPFLIKPNKDELEEIFNVKISDKKDICKYAHKLMDMGATNVIVSLGSKGALGCFKDGHNYYLDSLKGEVISTTGAGDSFVGGFMASYINNKDYKEAFKYGLCAASASVFSTSLANKEKVEELYKQLSQIEEIAY